MYEWGKLQGFVPLASTLEGKQDILEEAAKRGLAIVTWGRVNNQPDYVKAQGSWGVASAILDDVAEVVKALAE